MNIWSEVITALRGGFEEMGESIQAHQAIELLNDRIRQVGRDLQIDKESLAQALIAKKQSEQQAKTLQTEIDKFEGYAVKALETDEALALEVAEQIAILESELAEQKTIDRQSSEQCDLLRQHIRQMEQDLLRLKHQRDTIKASNSVQTAQENMSVQTNGKNGGKSAKPQTARDVLERIKQQQAIQADTAKEDLQSRLKKAGILDDDSEDLVSADKVLERIKGKG